MRNLRILLVDSHADGVESLANFLSHWGHEVRVTADGESALRELSGFDPDLVLAAARLADMDGPELAGLIRCACEGKRVPLLGEISASFRGNGVGYSAELDFDYHFGKPLNLTFLNRVLRFHRDRIGEPGEPFPLPPRQ